MNSDIIKILSDILSCLRVLTVIFSLLFGSFVGCFIAKTWFHKYE